MERYIKLNPFPNKNGLQTFSPLFEEQYLYLVPDFITGLTTELNQVKHIFSGGAAEELVLLFWSPALSLKSSMSTRSPYFLQNKTQFFIMKIIQKPSILIVSTSYALQLCKFKYFSSEKVIKKINNSLYQYKIFSHSFLSMWKLVWSLFLLKTYQIFYAKHIDSIKIAYIYFLKIKNSSLVCFYRFCLIHRYLIFQILQGSGWLWVSFKGLSTLKNESHNIYPAIRKASVITSTFIIFS